MRVAPRWNCFEGTDEVGDCRVMNPHSSNLAASPMT